MSQVFTISVYFTLIMESLMTEFLRIEMQLRMSQHLYRLCKHTGIKLPPGT